MLDLISMFFISSLLLLSCKISLLTINKKLQDLNNLEK
ncbi:hypothetical protein CTH30272_03204 [Allocatenococcus thiocycli]|nr:hypothetical protein CTH30272_03204 [Catenococcus thiocycli]